MPYLTTRNVTFRHVDEQLTDQQRAKRQQREVFKFYHQPAEAAILKQGSIRLGTLQKFRAIENPALADRNEGVRIARAQKTFFRAGAPIEEAVHPTSPMHSWAKDFVGDYARGDIIVDNIEFFEDVDFYSYSFSYSCSESVVRSFDAQPYDCVAKIHDIYALAETLIAIHPLLKGLYYSISPVIYRERFRSPSVEHPAPIIEAFEKNLSYAGNEEGRIVFFEFDVARNGLVYDKRPIAIPEDFADSRIKALFSTGKMPTA